MGALFIIAAGLYFASQGGGTLSTERGANLLGLKQGATGSDVAQLQEMLGAQGFDPGPADGIFGGETWIALVEFQQSVGLGASAGLGEVTQATAHHLFMEHS